MKKDWCLMGLFPSHRLFRPRLVKIFLASLLYFNTTQAQFTEDHNPVRFSFQAGINLSNMNFNLGEPPPPTHDPASWKTGFSFGFAISIPLSDKLFLQPEYFYTQRNGSDKSIAIDYKFDYLSMPVLLGYHLSPVFNILAGPQLELLLDAKAIAIAPGTTITHDVEERSLGVTAGVEANLFKSFYLSVNYFQGLNHIGIGQRSNIKEFKYQVFGLTAGYRF